MGDTQTPLPAFSFETHPDRYRHWKLDVSGPVARLTMAVRDHEPFRPGYVLKLNSYDLGVDLELADAVQRIRFEHPHVRAVVITGDKDKVFCSGANIHMLAASSHPFKVNFCKFTNETRLGLEDASRHSGVRWLAALNGACAGGGYELALACDEIVLVDDGSSAVSLPEVPLLGVLPGTGGLTRVVDKRKVRRDHADVFSTLGEGIRGKRAVDWRLVDAIVARSKFEAAITERAAKLAAAADADPNAKGRTGPGIVLDPLGAEVTDTELKYRHVTVALDAVRRTATLTVNAPTTGPTKDFTSADVWPLRVFRELDDALLRLRFHHEGIGLIVLKTRGSAENVLAWDAALAAATATDWRAREIAAFVGRTLRRLDTTARSIFAVIDEGSCFVGSLMELALAADRSYMLEDDDGKVTVRLSAANGGAYLMGHGLSRLGVRMLANPARLPEILAAGQAEALPAPDAEKLGLITIVADAIDFPDEVRLAIEERASLSPDALTGMEANLRFAGPESAETKVFGRLSAWQNWIFIRDNATGDTGALTLYGRPERPVFDFRRT